MNGQHTYLEMNRQHAQILKSESISYYYVKMCKMEAQKSFNQPANTSGEKIHFFQHYVPDMILSLEIEKTQIVSSRSL